jgi:Family of unknown function (DUF5678)
MPKSEVKAMQITSEKIIESIEQLPIIEQEKVWHWLEEKRKPRNSGENWNERIEKFRLARRWIDENRENYLGNWVCLNGDELVAFGKDAKKVYAEAKAKGIKIPFIEQIREAETAPFWGGWD